MMQDEYNLEDMVPDAKELILGKDVAGKQYTLWLQQKYGITDYYRIINLLSMVCGEVQRDKTALCDGTIAYGAASVFNYKGSEMKVTAYPITDSEGVACAVEISMPLDYADSPEIERFMKCLLDRNAVMDISPEELDRNWSLLFIPIQG